MTSGGDGGQPGAYTVGIMYAVPVFNTTRWVNVNATGGSLLNPNNVIGGLFGGSWDYGPRGEADMFITYPHGDHASFAGMMREVCAKGVVKNGC